MKVGQSIDIHPLSRDRALILGGVTILHYAGLVGHSDADVLVHAVAEAIIGALGLGDLGTHFPDNKEINKDRNSLDILKEVFRMMKERGYSIGNIDALILCEKPLLVPYIPAMKENIAGVLECDNTEVNIKATRGEGLGFVGEEKGIVASAVVLLKGKEDE